MNKFIVYKITSPSGKIYIGITSRDINHRISCHLYDAKHYNKFKLHKAINKYSWNNMNIDILKSELSKDLAIKYEKYYIKKYNSYKNGYNNTLGGEGAFGHRRVDLEAMSQRTKNRFNKEGEKEKQSERIKSYFKNNPEARTRSSENFKKISKLPHVIAAANKGKGTYEARLNNSKAKGGKPFLVYDKNNNFIKRYEIIKDACKDLGIKNTGQVCRVLKGMRTHTHGYRFIYE